MSEALTVFRGLLREVGLGTLAAAPDLETWFDATERLLAGGPAGAPEGDLLGDLARLWLHAEALPDLRAAPPGRWAPLLRARGLAPRLGHQSLVHRLAGAPSAEAAVVRAAARDTQLARLERLGDGELRDRVVGDTDAACAALDALRDRPPTDLGERVRRLFPELAALAAAADPHAAVEHEPARAEGIPALPLLDHLADRVLARKLAGLERADRALFQRDEALSAEAFADEVARVRRLEAGGVLVAVRTALMHLDFAKGGEPGERETWRARYGADLSVHNVAARRILERATAPGAATAGVLLAFSAFRDHAGLRDLVLALVEAHGLAGQAVRGETPLAQFAPFVRLLREREGDAADDALDCLHIVNICDTAGVREGLLTDELRAGMAAVEARLLAVAEAGDPHARRSLDLAEIEAELAAAEDRAWTERLAGRGEVAALRARVADRLARLRKGRIAAGEPRAETDRAVEALPEPALRELAALLRRCQLWYAESATAALSAEGQLKALALGLRAAVAAPSVDTGRLFNLSLLPLVEDLNAGRAGAGRAVPYRVRLLEALLHPLSVAAILAGEARLAGGLASFETEIGGAGAVALRFEETPEAAALLTLLAIYETKSSVAFHTTLKALCDLYGLRKDDFDRVSNEATYLAHMNSARSDKARMLDHVRPGRIVEVGPGGGVILALLEERFPESEVIGVDLSRMVIEALEARKAAEGRRWRLIEADAFRLPELVGPAGVDTVIFCSLLHEIYSYVEFPSDATGERGRFRLESVRELLRATWRALVPGGRIVIRDGVMPPPGVRIVRFLKPEARELYELFATQFEGRPIAGEPAGPDCVRLSSADAMEFLYKLTWGPQSFPYEIREQYGVLPYDAYRDGIIGWLSGNGAGSARWVPLPPAERSYLQPGYRTGLAGQVELLDGDGNPVELPDSNCLLVFEKP